MALKRKRSDTDMSPSSTVSWSCPSSSSSSPTARPHFQFEGATTAKTFPNPSLLVWDFHGSRTSLSSALNSRTRKRFRDNRPEESVVHELTINKLFAGQRQLAHVSPTPSQPRPQWSSTSSKQQSDLHSFWSIPHHARVVESHASCSSAIGFPQESCCEDCDAPLGNQDMMDRDSAGFGGEDEFRCALCCRRVCDVCAVITARRRCLNCARVA